MQTSTQEKGGISWIFLGIIVLAAAGIYLLMSRRRRAESVSIYEREITPMTVERTVTTVKTSSRPGPPITHQP